ncbi:MAG: AgmX/PglI C-terminal domain-containing protein [Myxococcales bacterium]|nr:AgmX/PglI C-terminal domain-containing protein [Myxococcales bacterium]
MHRHATWIAVVALVAAGCGSDRPAGPPRLGQRADVAALTTALWAAVAAPADARAAHVAAAVAAQCGPACACLTGAPGAPACPAANASVPAGWPALELVGRYLREQLELAHGRDREILAEPVAGLVVPVARLDAGVALPTATTVRPLSLAPIVRVDGQGATTVARHPVVTFGDAGAAVTDPPPARPVDGGALPGAVAAVAAELDARPAPAPHPDAGVDAFASGLDDADAIGGLLGDPDAGGFGFGRTGFGPGGGTGWGTIGTGRYGTIGGGERFELWSIPADREALAAGQAVFAFAPTLAVDTLDLLATPGGALAVRAGDRVAELPWTFRPGARIDSVVGVSLARTPDGLALANDGGALVSWPMPLTPADRATLEQRLAQLPPAARERLTVEVYDVTVADAVATLELAAALAPRITLVRRRTVAWGGGLYSGSTPTGPQVRIGIPQAVGDLDKAIIRRYIKRNILKISYCYEKELLVTPTLSGTVTTQFFISPTGSVSTANASGVSPEVASCVAGVIKAIEFPQPRGGGGVQVNYPFRFSPAP